MAGQGPRVDGDSAAVLARQLVLEDLARRTVPALAAIGVPSVLLKGPVTARLLYDRPDQHPYGDIDLLVPPRDFARARAALLDEGFRDLGDEVEQAYRSDNEAHLVRGGRCVDLHSRLVGVPLRRAQEAFEVLTEDLDELVLHGTPVPIFSLPARALHLALHAAQSKADGKALRDLARGVDRLPEDAWPAAARLAERVGAEAAFQTGLRRLPEGDALARRLALDERVSAEVWLRLHDGREEALALERLRALPSWQERRRQLRSWLRVPAAAPGQKRHRGQRSVVVGARLLLAVPAWLRALRAERRR
jgi:hypothetical protein